MGTLSRGGGALQSSDQGNGEAELQVLLGDALLAQDRLLEAYNQYDQALTEAEDLSRAHFGSGVILERWGQDGGSPSPL